MVKMEIDLFSKMEMPIRCPLCNEILLNDYGPGGHLFKNCRMKLDHTFSCGGRPFETVKMSQITISVGTYRELIIRWDLIERYTTVQRLNIPYNEPQAEAIKLPFVEIDLSEPFKAINKIKTLLPFV